MQKVQKTRVMGGGTNFLKCFQNRLFLFYQLQTLSNYVISYSVLPQWQVVQIVIANFYDYIVIKFQELWFIKRKETGAPQKIAQICYLNY